MTDENEISREWQKKHKQVRRAHLRAWYYKKRKQINMSFSLPKNKDMNEADIAYADFVERWNPFI